MSLLDVLIKDTETDELWYRSAVGVFIFLSVFFFAVMGFMILKKMSNIQPYFPALLGGATTALSGIPYKSFSSARRDRKYYSWMRVAWHKADENDDQSAAEKLRSEFNAIRQSNFGKG